MRWTQFQVTLWPFFVPLKVVKHLPCERYPRCTAGYKASLSPKREFRAKKAVLIKPCYFVTNLLPQAPIPLSCQFLTNLSFPCLKGINTVYFGYFFENHIFLWDSHMHQVKFVFFPPVYLLYVNLTVRLSKEPRREGGNSFMPLELLQWKKIEI